MLPAPSGMSRALRTWWARGRATESLNTLLSLQRSANRSPTRPLAAAFWSTWSEGIRPVVVNVAGPRIDAGDGWKVPWTRRTGPALVIRSAQSQPTPSRLENLTAAVVGDSLGCPSSKLNPTSDMRQTSSCLKANMMSAGAPPSTTSGVRC